MGSWINSFLGHLHQVSPVYALLILFLGMLLESTAVPLPSEVMLPLAGIWIARGKFGHGVVGFVVAMLAITAGSLAGSAISYAMGFYGGKPLVERFGRRFLVSSEHLKSGQTWLGRHGVWSVALGRVVFGLRHVQSLVAGTLRMRFASFLLATCLGCTIWNFAGVYLGFRFGTQIEHLLRSASLVMLGVIALVIVIFFGVRMSNPPTKCRSSTHKPTNLP